MVMTPDVIEIFNSFIETYYKISFFSAGVRQIKIDSIWSANKKEKQGVVNYAVPSSDRFFLLSRFPALAAIALYNILIKPIYFPSNLLEVVYTLIKRLIIFFILKIEKVTFGVLLQIHAYPCHCVKNPTLNESIKIIEVGVDKGVGGCGEARWKTNTFVMNFNILPFVCIKSDYTLSPSLWLGTCQGLKSIWYMIMTAFAGDSVGNCTETYPPSW